MSLSQEYPEADSSGRKGSDRLSFLHDIPELGFSPLLPLPFSAHLQSSEPYSHHNDKPSYYTSISKLIVAKIDITET